MFVNRRRRRWKREETLLFLKYYKIHKAKFNNSRKKVIAYNRVLRDMIKEGFDATSVDEESLRGKLKTLLDGYHSKRKIPNINKLAVDKAPFEDELNDIFGGKVPENGNSIDRNKNKISWQSRFSNCETSSTSSISNNQQSVDLQSLKQNERINLIIDQLIEKFTFATYEQPTPPTSPTIISFDEVDTNENNDVASACESVVVSPAKKQEINKINDYENYLNEKLKLCKEIRDEKKKAIQLIMNNYKAHWQQQHQSNLEQLKLLKEIKEKLNEHEKFCKNCYAD